MEDIFSSSIMDGSEELENAIIALFKSGEIQVKDHQNNGPTDAESIDWMESSQSLVKRVAAIYPNAMFTADNKYPKKNI